MTAKGDMEKILEQLNVHLRAHPKAEVRDAVKFLYQAVCGAEHFVSDPTAALRYLEAEAEAQPDDRSAPLLERLSGAGAEGFARLDLVALREITLDTLCAMFVRTAQMQRAESSRLPDLLDAFEAAGDGFDRAEKEAFLSYYRREGMPSVHHSAAYRAAYAPSYRVVSGVFAVYFPLFAAIDAALQRRGGLTLAVDGMCGAGKTVLARALHSVYDCNVIHMDDFFLPPDLRTPERLSEPGGNVHHERFLREVLTPLQAGESFSYRVFDCGVMDYNGMKSGERKPLTIVEGSYALHPTLRDGYDMRVFLKTTPDVQRARIEARSGAELLRRFEAEWIPLETRYFDACAVENGCDFVFET